MTGLLTAPELAVSLERTVRPAFAALGAYGNQAWYLKFCNFIFIGEGLYPDKPQHIRNEAPIEEAIETYQDTTKM